MRKIKYTHTIYVRDSNFNAELTQDEIDRFLGCETGVITCMRELLGEAIQSTIKLEEIIMIDHKTTDNRITR